jgi:hypothetical protein
MEEEKKVKEETKEEVTMDSKPMESNSNKDTPVSSEITKPDVSSEKKKNKVKVNKTMILVALLVALTGVLLLVSLQSKIGSPFKSTNITQEADFAHSSLAISEEPRVNPITGGSEVDVNINSGDNKATGAQIEIQYDPKALTNVDIKPGTFFENPEVPYKKIDAKTGRITLMVGNRVGQDGKEGEGPIAVLSFTKTTPDETTINLLPESLVTAEGYQSSVLKETASGVVR